MIYQHEGEIEFCRGGCKISWGQYSAKHQNQRAVRKQSGYSEAIHDMWDPTEAIMPASLITMHI